MNDEDLQPAPEAVKLVPAYDSCLCGATVSLNEQDRFVYSLRKLIRFTMIEHGCKATEARSIIVRDFITPLAREHGPLSPVFLNDEIIDGIILDEEKPLIIVPHFNGNKRLTEDADS